MAEIVMAIMGIVSDIITIVSMWLINERIPICVKGLLTTVAVVLAIVLVLLAIGSKDVKVKDYYYDKQEKTYSLYVKKNRYLMNDSVVSVYYKHIEGGKELDEFVAAGYVNMNDSEKRVEIIIFKIQEEKMKNIQATTKSYKKFHIKPNVEYTRISFLENEEEELADA